MLQLIKFKDFQRLDEEDKPNNNNNIIIIIIIILLLLLLLLLSNSHKVQVNNKMTQSINNNGNNFNKSRKDIKY